MLKVNVENFKNSGYFSGYVYRDELPEHLQAFFAEETVNIEGDFIITFLPKSLKIELDGNLVLFENTKQFEIGAGMVNSPYLLEQLEEFASHKGWHMMHAAENGRI